MKKFVAWGHKNSHTHSHIHRAYTKAFDSLGWQTYWLNPGDDVSGIDFSNTLFLTEGQVDANIPLRKDCKYILHNCDSQKYEGLDFITLQVFTNDVYPREVEKLSDFVYWQNNAKTLYQPWATDFLPNEIHLLDRINFSENKIVYWVGSVWGGQGNMNEVQLLVNSLSSRGIRFENPTNVSDNKYYINNSYISPSIQGKWQVDNGYIPCRIFKNISYGEFGITNSKSVYNLFNNTIIYDENIDLLVEKSIEHRNKITLNELNQQIQFVKDNHTFINRINTILKFI